MFQNFYSHKNQFYILSLVWIYRYLLAEKSLAIFGNLQEVRREISLHPLYYCGGNTIWSTVIKSITKSSRNSNSQIQYTRNKASKATADFHLHWIMKNGHNTFFLWAGGGVYIDMQGRVLWKNQKHYQKIGLKGICKVDLFLLIYYFEYMYFGLEFYISIEEKILLKCENIWYFRYNISRHERDAGGSGLGKTTSRYFLYIILWRYFFKYNIRKIFKCLHNTRISQ